MDQVPIEGALTRLRRERKVVLSREQADEFEGAITARYNLATPVDVEVCSVYFDRRDGGLSRAALTVPRDCLKVRTKEYAPDWGSPKAPRCVVELKRQRGELTRKRRFWLPRAALRPLFDGPIADLLPFGPQGLSAFAALRTAGGAGLLRPVVGVRYRRRILQLAADMRVTFDRDLSFHRAPSEVLLGELPLSGQRLGEPFARETGVVVELKTLGAKVPSWAESLAFSGSEGFSKFGAALMHLRLPERADA
jgi:hypothetical protein